MAGARPISWRSRYVPPAPGMMARRVSGRPTEAAAENTRRVHASASSRPPPRAIEETAAMDGMERDERARKVRRRSARNRFVLCLLVVRSRQGEEKNKQKAGRGKKKAEGHIA